MPPLNRFLAQVIEVQQTRIINRRTGSECEILTTDKMGSHGARPDVVILDELTHQRDKDFASTLLDNLDKMPCGLGVVVTNAGFDPSWQLDWKRTFAKQRRWRIIEYRDAATALSLAVALAKSGNLRFLHRGVNGILAY